MKKAQTVTQVFVFFFALIVTSAVLLLGYNMIRGLMQNQQKVDIVMFEKELSVIKEVSNEYGSVKNLDLLLPSGFNEICFIDLNQNCATAGSCATGKPLIDNSWNSKVKKDIFLIPDGEVSFYSNTTLDFDGGLHSLCVKASGGKVKIAVEGRA